MIRIGFKCDWYEAWKFWGKSERVNITLSLLSFGISKDIFGKHHFELKWGLFGFILVLDLFW